MFPSSFIQRIKSQLSDADQLLRALQTPPVTSVRKHPIKGAAINFGYDQVPWCNEGYYLAERPVFTLDPAFHAGGYYVQESSSMFIHQMLDQLYEEKDIRILDACAAPGGKSTLIASWLDGNGLLVSNEVIKSRAPILLENIIKWGYSNTWVTNTDVHVLGGLAEFFDCVVIDAPCSGEGLFRKDKNAIDEWSEANCDLCASRQKKIIADLLPALKVNGFCIYSTCTFNPAENDENLQWMLNEFPLELIPLNISGYAQIESTNGGYIFYPHLNRGEGFYCCVLQKKDETITDKTIRRTKVNWAAATTKHIDFESLVKSPELFKFFQKQDDIIGIKTRLLQEWKEITSITKVLGGYLTIGGIKGKDLIPHHALAMSLDYNNIYPSISVDRTAALYYLAKKDFQIAADSKGWHTIRYDSFVLGFAKLLSNRINNYYPMDWRIRMDV